MLKIGLFLTSVVVPSQDKSKFMIFFQIMADSLVEFKGLSLFHRFFFFSFCIHFEKKVGYDQMNNRRKEWVESFKLKGERSLLF